MDRHRLVGDLPVVVRLAPVPAAAPLRPGEGAPRLGNSRPADSAFAGLPRHICVRRQGQAGGPGRAPPGSGWPVAVNFTEPVAGPQDGRQAAGDVVAGLFREHGLSLVASAQSGQWTSFAAISADGSKVYFATYAQLTIHQTGPVTGQVRVVDLATGRSRVVYAPAGQPGLITSDPGAGYLLLQIQGKAEQSVRLARLDLATGKVTNLPSAWLGPGAVLYW